MAIVAVKLGTSIHSNADATSYTYVSATYTDNRLYLLFTNSSIASGTAPSVNSVTGGGLTWVEATAGAGGNLWSGNVRRCQCFRAMVTSGATAGELTIGLDGTSTGMDACVVEVTGMDTGGTNGSAAVVQVAEDQDDANVSTLVFDTMAAFGSSDNRPVAFIAYRLNVSAVEESGYTLLDTSGHPAPVGGSIAEYHPSSPETTPSATWTGTAATGGLAVEVKAAAAGTTHEGAATLAAAATASLAAVLTLVGALTMAAIGTIGFAAVAEYAGTSSMVASASVSAGAVADLVGTTSVLGSATVSADGTIGATHEGASTLPASAAMSSDGTVEHTGALSMPGSAVVSAAAEVEHTGSSTLPGAATLLSDGVVVYAGASTMPGAATLSADGTVIGAVVHEGAATLACAATVQAIGTGGEVLQLAFLERSLNALKNRTVIELGIA